MLKLSSQPPRERYGDRPSRYRSFRTGIISNGSRCKLMQQVANMNYHRRGLFLRWPIRNVMRCSSWTFEASASSDEEYPSTCQWVENFDDPKTTRPHIKLVTLTGAKDERNELLHGELAPIANASTAVSNSQNSRIPHSSPYWSSRSLDQGTGVSYGLNSIIPVPCLFNLRRSTISWTAMKK